MPPRDSAGARAIPLTARPPSDVLCWRGGRPVTVGGFLAEAAAQLVGTNEVAVMIECREPLVLSEQASACEDPSYTTSRARGLGLL